MTPTNRLSMTPTNRLRFVEREFWIELTSSGPEKVIAKKRKIKILQQLWKSKHAGEDGLHDEWRDVPLEEET